VSQLASIADAVVAAINAEGSPLGALTPPVVAVRKWRPRRKLEEMKVGQVHVTVVPKAWKGERFTREAWNELPDVDIGFEVKLKTLENVEIDPLDDLVEAVYLYLRNLAVADVTFDTIQRPVIYDIEALDDKHVWRAVLTLTCADRR
jgi:hypothetical protein